MAEQRSPQARLLRRLAGWVVVVPLVSVALALLGQRFLVFPVVLAFAAVGVLRVVLGGGSERGFMWGALALVAAMAVAGPSPFLGGSYVALRGERVDATVVERRGPMEHRIVDSVTNEDLGLLNGLRPKRPLNPREFTSRFYEVGDTVPVLVVRRLGLEPVPVERAETVPLTIWLIGWVLGLGLTVANAVRTGRDAPAG